MKANVNDVALALEDNRNYAEFFLNKEDGRIVRITRDVLEAVEDDDAESLSESSQEEIAQSEAFIFNPKTQLVMVPAIPFAQRVKLMIEFSQTVAGEDFKKEIGDISHSRNPSLRFHNALVARPDEQKKWTDFKNRFYHDQAEQWLKNMS